MFDKIESAKKKGLSGLVGFDGFVDEVIHVVNQRQNAQEYTRLEYMNEYANKIANASGLSFNIEMLPVMQKIGGNGPIFANALLQQNLQLTYIGALGKPNIHPVFDSFVQKCNGISVADVAHTDAIEFLDGKIISGKLHSLSKMSWEDILQEVSVEEWIDMINKCDFLAFMNWTMVIQMSDIWKHILQDVAPYIERKKNKKILFIDLADPEKRTKKDILEALSLIEKFNKYFKVVLGLNEKEALEIVEVVGGEIVKKPSLEGLLTYLKSKIEVDVIVVHPVKRAGAIHNGEIKIVDGPYCKEPKLTTGAGDNFNAGFVLGQVVGLSLKESLLLGVSSSGYYVREGKSANAQELQAFIES